MNSEIFWALIEVSITFEFRSYTVCAIPSCFRKDERLATYATQVQLPDEHNTAAYQISLSVVHAATTILLCLYSTVLSSIF